jgi:SAM-dependent methyltransferase
MDDYRKANLDLWNNWAEINAASSTYDLQSFRQGKISLNPLELEEVGDVSGKSLLHLQCHFGKDTMSWARLGATVTGADFSDRAIELARALAAELNIPARFILSDLYNLPNVLQGEFDIVYTTYGAISWLPDMEAWGRVAAHFVKPGGFFYVADFHPFAYVFENSQEDPAMRVTYPMSNPHDKPLRFETKGNYADPDSDYQGVEYGWNHSMSDIINALIKAGLQIDFLHEHHFSVDGSMFKGLQPDGPDYFVLSNPTEREAIPMMFSIKAHKPVET